MASALFDFPNYQNLCFPQHRSPPSQRTRGWATHPKGCGNEGWSSCHLVSLASTIGYGLFLSMAGLGHLVVVSSQLTN
jgi:hypothetical protein